MGSKMFRCKNLLIIIFCIFHTLTKFLKADHYQLKVIIFVKVQYPQSEFRFILSYSEFCSHFSLVYFYQILKFH